MDPSKATTTTTAVATTTTTRRRRRRRPADRGGGGGRREAKGGRRAEDGASDGKAARQLLEENQQLARRTAFGTGWRPPSKNCSRGHCDLRPSRKSAMRNVDDSGSGDQLAKWRARIRQGSEKQEMASGQSSHDEGEISMEMSLVAWIRPRPSLPTRPSSSNSGSGTIGSGSGGGGGGDDDDDEHYPGWERRASWITLKRAAGQLCGPARSDADVTQNFIFGMMKSTYFLVPGSRSARRNSKIGLVEPRTPGKGEMQMHLSQSWGNWANGCIRIGGEDGHCCGCGQPLYGSHGQRSAKCHLLYLLSVVILVIRD